MNQIAQFTDLNWTIPTKEQHQWFQGKRQTCAASGPTEFLAEVCADPKSEVVEALRWVRNLLASGNVEARDIAIAATSTPDWDDHFLACSSDAELPLHFSHGVPALSTYDGQACAALADILTRGISQERIWRLFRQLPARAFKVALPEHWFVGIPRAAGLRTLDQWREALIAARPHRIVGDNTEGILMPLLELLARGPDASREAGRLLLGGASLSMWEEALQSTPPHAIALSLERLRVGDDRDPANNVVWCPASHLAASPRPYTRLIGLTSKSWPRFANDDPLIPHHLLDRRRLHPTTIAERDRRHFEIIRSRTSKSLVLSRPERNAKGSILSPSSLWPSQEIVRKRDRIPEHAFSESDRLLARPRDAAQLAHVRQSQLCWRNWQHVSDLTPHDGLITANHPAVLTALTQTQSTTRLQRLLRDPLGFVWRYALGWHSNRLESESFQLDPVAFGELVHEIISNAVITLEPDPGIARASETEIAEAIASASSRVLASWPLQRSVPPAILWQHTVEEAARRTSKGLAADEKTQANTRTWSEVPFGQKAAPTTDLPWDSTVTIPIGTTGLVFGGRIDRLDVRSTGDGAQITDYKSIKPPPKTQRIALGQGRELQRVLYAIAVRELLPEVRTIVARLIYLANEPAIFELRDNDLEKALTDATTYLIAAMNILKSGRMAPRSERNDAYYDDIRLALPADSDGYFRRKVTDFRSANQKLSKLWNAST